jgi:plastocyanin
MKLPLTATALVCVGAAGIAVGALVLEPAKPSAAPAPAPAATAAPVVSAAPAGTAPAGYPTTGAGPVSAPPAGPTAPTASTPAPAATAEISDFAFATSPVAPGAVVTVTNRDGAGHTFTADQFDTGTIDGGSSASFTAPVAPGSYSIVCLIHPSMTGTLVVA